jgi:4-hydroxybenzoate polyprenyltransferase
MGFVFGLLRAGQWYKNLVVFFALFFTNNMFNPGLLWLSLWGFLGLCLMSSSYYILNDIGDRASDLKHPEKRFRPVASGRVGVPTAYAVSALLFVSAAAIGYGISLGFLSCLLLLFASSLAYSLWLRDVAFLDVHVIGLNFLIRAVAGSVAIGVPSSPWLISTVFFSALLLGLSKRRSELMLLGAEAFRFKSVYRAYTLKLLDSLLTVTATTLLLAYIFYTFSVHDGGYMMLTIPFATYTLFRFLQMVFDDHVAARRTELLFREGDLVLVACVWAATIFFIMYRLRI